MRRTPTKAAVTKEKPSPRSTRAGRKSSGAEVDTSVATDTTESVAAPAGEVASLAAPAEAPLTVKQQFELAVGQFVDRARQDPYLEAVILFGSLSYDTVWEKSDIDLMVIRRDVNEFYKGNTGRDDSVSLTENGLSIHAILLTRSKFKKMIEGTTQGSFMHSAFGKSRLVWTRDETIRELYDNITKIGARDREVQLLRAGTWALPTLYKAEKWLKVKRDVHYAFHWVLHCLTPLAQVECFLNGEVPGREVIQQALKINPAFFGSIYTDLIDAKKTEKNVGAAIYAIDGYLTRKTRVLFGPILDYLKREGIVRSVSEIDAYFKNQMNVNGVSLACEWLADKGVIVQASSPIRLTKQSRVEFQEMAFYYDGEGPNG
jgi:uncharacterized protein